ncbi:MAG: Gfo/Idh/MocA family oxidoreductase [Clostridia bacterium]|nr:Gfo/Idh/MocA family oxidoreductase [Clostridia bacterium]
MKYKPVKTAVIGSGMISDTYLHNLKDTFSIIDLVGCSDIVREKAEAQAEKYGIRCMTNEEILSDPEIEMVLNLTYASAHYEVSKAILSSGKHCYSEKMMCLTLEEANELKKIADEKNVRFCTAPDTFLGASQQTSRYVVDKGLIGEPVTVLICLSRGYHMIKEDKDDAVRKYSVMREGGGIPYDMGGYYLHQLMNIFGPVKQVCGFSKTRNQTRPYLNPRHTKFNEDFFVNTPNTIASAFELECGVYGTLLISSEHSTVENVFRIIGTEGQLELGDPNEFGEKIYITKNGSERLEFPISHPYSEGSRGIGAADMAWGIRTGRPNRLSFEMGYHALEFIKALEESSKSGKTIRLNTKFERPCPISSEYYNGTSMERNLFLYQQ